MRWLEHALVTFIVLVFAHESMYVSGEACVNARVKGFIRHLLGICIVRTSFCIDATSCVLRACVRASMCIG